MAGEKITGIVLNDRLELVGLGVNVPGRGQVVWSMASLKAGNFRNSQLAITNGRISELGNFKLNKCKVNFFNEKENRMVLPDFVDNAIEVVAVEDGKNDKDIAGFAVNICGFINNYPIAYEKFMNVCNLLKPTNVTVVTKDNGYRYVRALRGNLSDFPRVSIGLSKAAGKQMVEYKSGAENVKADNKINNAGEQGPISILGLLEIINSNKGYVVKLPDEAYKSRTSSTSKVDSGFASMGIQVGNAAVAFGEKNLNGNIKFKDVGVVSGVGKDGTIKSFIAYNWCTKSIIANGKCYMDKIGVLVDSKLENDIIRIAGTKVFKGRYDDARTTNMLRALYQLSPDYVIYVLDISELPVASLGDTTTANITSSNFIAETAMRLYVNKLRLTVYKDLCKKLENAGTLPGMQIEKEVNSLYANLSSDDLELAQELGIDTCTGAYTKRVAYESKSDTTESGNVKKDVEIEVVMKGPKTTGWTYEDALGVFKGAISTDTDELFMFNNREFETMLKEIASKGSPQEAYEEAKKQRMIAEKEIEKLKKMLWLVKMAMVKSGSVTMNSVEWEKVVSKAKDPIFRSTNSSHNNLCIKISNIAVN